MKRALAILAERRKVAVEANPCRKEIEECPVAMTVQRALAAAIDHDHRFAFREPDRIAPPPWLLPPLA